MYYSVWYTILIRIFITLQPFGFLYSCTVLWIPHIEIVSVPHRFFTQLQLQLLIRITATLSMSLPFFYRCKSCFLPILSFHRLVHLFILFSLYYIPGIAMDIDTTSTNSIAAVRLALQPLYACVTGISSSKSSHDPTHISNVILDHLQKLGDTDSMFNVVPRCSLQPESFRRILSR